MEKINGHTPSFAGEMEFVKKWPVAKKGDKISVLIGVVHTFRNPSDKIVTVCNTHQLALNMEKF